MCTYSMVFDHFDGRIPTITQVQAPANPEWYKYVPLADDFQKSIDELEKSIDNFKKAGAAAEVVDNLTNQPDCLDPEKAKLLDRIRELEETLAKAPEFVMVKGANLEPGVYRVIDRKLFKVIEP